MIRNLIFGLVLGVGLALAPVATAATDPTGVFTLPGVGNLDVGEKLVLKYASSGNQNNRGLPSVVTNAAAKLATNVITPIINDANLAIQFDYAGTPTNDVATTNIVWRFVASADGGRKFTTAPWLTLNTAINGSNGVNQIQIIPSTNFYGITHLKLLSISNAATVGAGSVWPTNITFTQNRRPPTPR